MNMSLSHFGDLLVGWTSVFWWCVVIEGQSWWKDTAGAIAISLGGRRLRGTDRSLWNRAKVSF